MIIAKGQVLAAIAALTLLGGTTAVAGMDTTTDDVVSSDASPTPEVSPSPTASPLPDEDGDDGGEVEPTPTPEVEATNVPNGNAYGWWRNHGVIKEKPGNGPKPKHSDGTDDDSTEGDS